MKLLEMSKLQDYCKALKNVDVDLRNHVKMLEEKWKPKLRLIEPFKPICSTALAMKSIWQLSKIHTLKTMWYISSEANKKHRISTFAEFIREIKQSEETNAQRGFSGNSC